MEFRTTTICKGCQYFYFVDFSGDYVVCRDSVMIERLPSEELARELVGCLMAA